jgi:uracil-DNA glycosylase
MTQQERLIELFGISWYNQLNGFLHSNEFNTIGQKLLQKRKEVEVYPVQADIFKAFRKTPFDKVKVVLIGLHPYTSGRKATGLAFGVDLNVTDKLTTSIKQIHREIENDLNVLNIDFDYTLEGLAEQGVLLLNLALTSDSKDIDKHIVLWKPFIDEIFKILYQNKDVIYIIIGADALNNMNYPFMNLKNYNRSYVNTIPSSKFASYCNAILYMRKEEINWNIK